MSTVDSNFGIEASFSENNMNVFIAIYDTMAKSVN
jgi:hypothetical protein